MKELKECRGRLCRKRAEVGAPMHNVGMSEKATASPKPSGSQALSAPQKALRKLGLVRDEDLALHLPLRYEDET
ncbi:MAG: hypothetical protein RL697_192, partial [Pseudomonadota bacterium]